MCKGIVALRDAAAAGNLAASKAQYVATVAELKSWTQEAGIAAALKGL